MQFFASFHTLTFPDFFLNGQTFFGGILFSAIFFLVNWTREITSRILIFGLWAEKLNLITFFAFSMCPKRPQIIFQNFLLLDSYFKKYFQFKKNTKKKRNFPLISTLISLMPNYLFFVNKIRPVAGSRTFLCKPKFYTNSMLVIP